MPIKSNKYSAQRIDQVSKSIRELSIESQKVQGSFWESFLESVMLSLSAKGKVLQDSSDNREIINSLGETIDKDIRPNQGREFTSWYVDQLKDIGDLNGKYFEPIDPDGGILVKTTERLLKLLGLSGDSVKNGSFLHTLTDFTELYRQLQSNLIGSIFTKQPFDLPGAKQLILGTGKGLVIPDKTTVKVLNHSGGAVEAAINTKTFDAFQQYDRSLQKSMANELGLNYAIYQGGLIKTSRDFCIERNDRVFTREEIEKFGTKDDRFGGYTNKATGDFDGKREPYNPFVDCGSWNCRHHWDFLSNELGEILYNEQNNRAVPLDI